MQVRQASALSAALETRKPHTRAPIHTHATSRRIRHPIPQVDTMSDALRSSGATVQRAVGLVTALSHRIRDVAFPATSAAATAADGGLSVLRSAMLGGVANTAAVTVAPAARGAARPATALSAVEERASAAVVALAAAPPTDGAVVRSPALRPRPASARKSAARGGAADASPAAAATPVAMGSARGGARGKRSSVPNSSRNVDRVLQ